MLSVLRMVKPVQVVTLLIALLFVWWGPGGCLRDETGPIEAAQKKLDSTQSELDRQKNVLATINPDAVLVDAEIRLAQLVPETPPELIEGKDVVQLSGRAGSDFGAELTRCDGFALPPIRMGSRSEQAFGGEVPTRVKSTDLLVESRITVNYWVPDLDWVSLLECVRDHNKLPHVAVESLEVTSSVDAGSSVRASYIYLSCSERCEEYEDHVERDPRLVTVG